MNTTRGRQAVSKRDVTKFKQNTALYSPKITKKQPLPRKNIAALKDAEIRSEVEPNKRLKLLAAKDYEKKTKKPKRQGPHGNNENHENL